MTTEQRLQQLEEAAFVTSQLQVRHSEMLKEHVEWLHSHDLAMTRIDERIEKLGCAIGEFIARQN